GAPHQRSHQPRRGRLRPPGASPPRRPPAPAPNHWTSRISSKNRENPWSDRHGERTMWPSARLRPHNDGMTGSLVAARNAGRHAGRDAGVTAPADTESGGSGSAPLLTVSGLNLSYGRLRALSDI